MTVCTNSYTFSESEAEDMANLAAVFVFLKNDCGYQNLPNGQIRRALTFFAQQNQWDLSNYDTFNMKALGGDSHRDLSGIGIPTAKKCEALMRDSLGLLVYAEQSPAQSRLKLPLPWLYQYQGNGLRFQFSLRVWRQIHIDNNVGKVTKRHDIK